MFILEENLGGLIPILIVSCPENIVCVRAVHSGTGLLQESVSYSAGRNRLDLKHMLTL